MGGAGSWSAHGARLFSPPPKSKSVGWVVDAGSKFPVDAVKSSNHVIPAVSCVRPLIEKPQEAINIYGENEERGESAVMLGRPSSHEHHGT